MKKKQTITVCFFAFNGVNCSLNDMNYPRPRKTLYDI